MNTSFVKSLSQAVKHWYFPVIIGILFIIVGIYTLAQPIDALVTLSIIFSISFLVAGFSDIIYAVANIKTLDNWGWTLFLGIISFLVGAYLLWSPALSELTLTMYIGFLLMFRSFHGISIALDLKHYNAKNWGTLLFLGILGLVLSFILLWSPNFAGLSLVVWVGITLIILGAYGIYAGIKLKSLHAKQ